MNKVKSFCENCGYANDEDDKFCEKCGNNLFKTTQSDFFIEKKSKLTFIFPIILIIGFLVNGCILMIEHFELDNRLTYMQNKNDRLEKKLDNI